MKEIGRRVGQRVVGKGCPTLEGGESGFKGGQCESQGKLLTTKLQTGTCHSFPINNSLRLFPA